MRRHARAMRRNGLQPVVVIDGDERLPDLAVIVLGRVLWRYRSELAPLNLAVALVVGAAVLRLEHPGWWPFLLGAGTAVASALVAVGERVGLARRAERLYAAAVAFSCGAWTAAAVALGPLRTPLPALLVGGGLVLSVPWWTHRRRRARVRVDRQLAAWPDIARAIGLPGSAVQSATADVWGWRARVALARGQTLTDATGKVPALESALGTFRGAVRVTPTRDGKANRVELRVLDTDPHADAIAWPGPSVASITEPIDFGPFEDATAARVSFLRRHALIGGVAGSGKSGGINVLMGNLVACPDAVVWAIDLKRGMELQPWAPCIDRLATTPEQARMLLRDAVAVLEARASALAAQGRRVWEPSPDMPALVIVIDEYAELTDDAPDAMPDTDSIARRGRAVAVTLAAATQRPTQKAMGKGAVRSQMDVRISFRVRERKDVDLILGQGMLNAGWHAHTLDAPGKFLINAPDHDTPRRARAYLLTDQTVARTADHYADHRPELDSVSRNAVEQAPVAEEHRTDDSDTVLWDMLTAAPDDGCTVPRLIAATGRSRPWVYQRLRELADTGRVTQVSRGHWRAANNDSP